MERVSRFRSQLRLAMCSRCWGGGVVERGVTEAGIPRREQCPDCRGIGWAFAPPDERDRALRELRDSKAILIRRAGSSGSESAEGCDLFERLRDL